MPDGGVSHVPVGAADLARSRYTADCYAAFVRVPDGNKLEAMLIG